MNRHQITEETVRRWVAGECNIYVVTFHYNNGLNHAYNHCEADAVAGPDTKDAFALADRYLDEGWKTVTPEFCKIYQACPENYQPLIAKYRRDEVLPNFDQLAADLLSKEDFNGRSAFDELRPVKVVSRIPSGDRPEKQMKKALLVRIHGIVDDIGAKTISSADGNACKRLFLDRLPFQFFDKGSQFTGFLFRHFANKGEDAATTLNDYPITDSSVQVLQDYLREMDKVHKLVFTGNAKMDCVGCVTVRTAVADPDAAVGRKARLDEKPRRFKVTLRFEVSYSNEVEAADEDEAVDLVKQQAQTAPSGDFDWHGITDYDATEAE